MVQKIKDNKKSILIVAATLLVCVIAILIGVSFENANKISELEKMKLTEISDDVTAYLEYVEDAGNIDDYIIYALEYNYNVNNSTELSTKDMIKLLNGIFTKKITEKDSKVLSYIYIFCASVYIHALIVVCTDLVFPPVLLSEL